MKHAIVLSLSAILICCTIARAEPIEQRTAPGKWFEPLLPEPDAEPAYPDYSKGHPLALAHLQIEAGQYRRALATLQHIQPSPAQELEVALAKSQAMEASGDLDGALRELTTPAIASDQQAQAAQAHVLLKQEKLADAQLVIDTLLAAHSDNIAAHYEQGACFESQGQYTKAAAAYNWFVEKPISFIDRFRGHPQEFSSAPDLVMIAEAIDRWATLTRAYEVNDGLHNIILSMFTKAYSSIDMQYGPAHDAAADYFLSHDNTDEARKELNAELLINPHDVTALSLVGKIAIAEYNFGAADAQVAAIRRVDPDAPAAAELEARNLLLQRRPEDALAVLSTLHDRIPRDVTVIGLIAAADALVLREDDAAQMLKQADEVASDSPVAYFEMAEQLSAMRQYPRAAVMYKIALQRAPWWTEVRNGLGLLMTQSGDEATARVVLEAAHAVDPFNVRTTNYLRLLDMMDTFARKESAHFIVTYDAKQDPMIPEYFSDYLESIYTDVCGDFKFEPAEKTLIEVFPTHDSFSARITGSPWIATVGASTGRVIALAAPRDGAGGTFNWSRVVRHEFTHTVTLGATDNRIAHWFTEGLAVWEEHSPIPWEWVPMLYDAVTHRKLFPIANLTWAFVRPKEPSDRQLAYAESYWICNYVEEKYGHQAILDLCTEFKIGHDADQAFSRVLHENTTVFYDQFQSYCEKQVAGWGYDKETSDVYEQLVNDADALIHTQDYAGASAKWLQIVGLRPMDMLPHQRLMGLYLQQEQWDKAVEQLRILDSVELKDNKYAKVLARLLAKIGKNDEAVKAATKAVYTNPYDVAAHELLAKLDTAVGDTAGADRESRVIPVLKAWLETASQDTAGVTGAAAPAPTGN